MRVLVAGEFSGIVREAFRRRGHDAVSCDYRPSEQPGPHIQGSWFDHDVVNRGWDMMIAHPDCTFLVVSGARWMSVEWREEARLAALHTVKALMKFPIDKIAIENPVGKLSSLWRGPDQIIQPYQFGDPFKKTTCLWLKNLPPLVPTNDLGDGEQACWKEAPVVWPNRRKAQRMNDKSEGGDAPPIPTLDQLIAEWREKANQSGLEATRIYNTGCADDLERLRAALLRGSGRSIGAMAFVERTKNVKRKQLVNARPFVESTKKTSTPRWKRPNSKRNGRNTTPTRTRGRLK